MKFFLFFLEGVLTPPAHTGKRLFTERDAEKSGAPDSL